MSREAAAYASGPRRRSAMGRCSCRRWVAVIVAGRRLACRRDDLMSLQRRHDPRATHVRKILESLEPFLLKPPHPLRHARSRCAQTARDRRDRLATGPELGLRSESAPFRGHPRFAPNVYSPEPPTGSGSNRWRWKERVKGAQGIATKRLATSPETNAISDEFLQRARSAGPVASKHF